MPDWTNSNGSAPFAIGVAADNVSRRAPSPAARSVPPFLLPDHEGWLVSSEEMRAQGPYVLAFFHGIWCADCRTRLAMLQSGLHRIHEFGADVIACSPETLEFPRRLKAEEGIRFHIVSDVDCALSVDLGLAYPVSCDTRRHLRGAGIDLEARNGDRRWMLPIPTIMIVDRMGTVAKTFDGNQRIEIDEIVDALCRTQLGGLGLDSARAGAKMVCVREGLQNARSMNRWSAQPASTPVAE